MGFCISKEKEEFNDIPILYLLDNEKDLTFRERMIEKAREFKFMNEYLSKTK